MAKNVTTKVQPKKEYIPKYIIVHHSAAKAPVPQFDAINEWHKERDFVQSELGYYVGYHRVIEKNGSVRIARGDLERDCDALGHNFDSLSVCLVGNLEIETPTQLQLNALGEILREWCTTYHVDIDDIYPHRHFAATSCPGRNLPDNMIRIQYLISQRNYATKQLAAEQARSS